MSSLFPETADGTALSEATCDIFLEPSWSEPYGRQQEVETTEDRIYVTFVPEWLHRAFTKRHSLTEIHDYAKLREVASKEDVAFVMSFGDAMYKIVDRERDEEWPAWLYQLIDYRDQRQMSDDQWVELQQTVLPMARADATVTACKNFLQGVKKDSTNEPAAIGEPGSDKDAQTQKERAESMKCRIVSGVDRLYIIVREGFSRDLEDPVSRLIFFRTVLKGLYARHSLATVNSSGWYRAYMAALMN